MKRTQLRALRGRNVWTKRTALEVTIHVTAEDAAEAPQLRARLRTLGPSLAVGDEAVAVGLPAWALGQVTLELQRLAGVPVSFCTFAATSTPGEFKTVVQYRDEEVGRKALELATQLLETAPGAFDIAAAARQLRALDEEVRLGPSTGAIVRAAEARGIPVRRLTRGSLVLFGWGSRQRRILAAETDRTSAIGESLAQDKELTKMLLRSVGVPVPDGGPVESAEEAWEMAQDIGTPVVVKPQYGNQGRGVAVNLTTREQIEAAFVAARAEGSSILVERYAPGADHRLLVVGGKLVAAARREPPAVVGDGVHTIEELVADVNRDPRRGEDHATSLSKMRLDAIGLAVLAAQELTPDAVPAAGRRVLLRQNANLSTGGSAVDVTERVHPEAAMRAVDAARVIGLDIAGVDIICSDIARPLEEQGGIVVEVNAAPGLRMHLDPSDGRPRPVGEAIVASMFADAEDGRIPVIAVTGNNGKTTTTRLIAHVLRWQGRRVGMTCTDGIYIDERRIDTDDCSGPKSARAVLLNPAVDAAVLETARGGILREGLGFDRCSVAVVTNIGEGDHLGLAGIETAEQLTAVKRVVVEAVAPTGAAVLNAADPRTAAMASYCPGEVIFFARDPEHPVLAAHRARGGRCAFVRDGAIVQARRDGEVRVAALGDVPITRGGSIGFQVDNVLAAAATCLAMDVPIETVRAGLATFVNDIRHAPGRFNMMEYRGGTVICDYGHNADALVALVDAIDHIPHRRRLVIYSAAGDRRDADILRQSQILGDSFDEVIIYEDQCTRGRPEGEVKRLMREGLAAGRRAKNIVECAGEFRAIETGLAMLEAGDLILVQVDQVEASLAFVERTISAELALQQPTAARHTNARGSSGGAAARGENAPLVGRGT